MIKETKIALSEEELLAKLAKLEAEKAEQEETIAELNTALSVAEAKATGSNDFPKQIVHGKKVYLQHIPGCRLTSGEVVGTAELEASEQLCKDLVEAGAAIVTIKEN